MVGSSELFVGLVLALCAHSPYPTHSHDTLLTSLIFLIPEWLSGARRRKRINSPPDYSTPAVLAKSGLFLHIFELNSKADPTPWPGNFDFGCP